MRGGTNLDLKKKSIEVIKTYQHESGAYVASPNFENYKFSWLRDGSFIAYAMDTVDEFESAYKFYCWVDHVILNHEDKYHLLIQKTNTNQKLSPKDFLACRYTLVGQEANDEWPNFQIDGYGTWLWGLSEHIKKTNNTSLLQEFAKSIEITINYLMKFWDLPNSDCWEENEDKIHPSTLACVYGGLTAINDFYQRDDIKDTTVRIKKFLLEHAIYDNRITKYIGSTSVDASLLWLTVPFNVFAPTDSYMMNTVGEMEKLILHKGGVHRYPEDTYYGGGEWLLLSSWLGWYYTLTGRMEEARKQLEWVEKQADDQGFMTEQVLDHVNNTDYIDKWIKQWGPVAKPLLWSHAMYLVLHENVKKQ